MKKRSLILGMTLWLLASAIVCAEDDGIIWLDDPEITNDRGQFSASMPDFLVNETGVYDLRYYEMDVYENYKNAMESVWHNYLNDCDKVQYCQLVDKMDGMQWAVDGASVVLGETLDQKRYLEILTGMLSAMSYDLKDYMDAQKDLDKIKDVAEYGQDVVDIMTAVVGVDASATANATENIRRQLEDLQYSIGVTWDGAGFVLEQQEKFELYEQILQNYTMYSDFLNAIETYAEDENLAAAANILKKDVGIMLRYQLEQIADAAGDAAVFLGKDVIFDGIIPELLASKDVLALSETDYEVLRFLNDSAKAVGDMISLGQASFKLGILGGDMLFGTTNIYRRYNEVFAIRKIRDALNKAIEAEAVSIQSPEQINRIEKIQNLMENLLYVDYRGYYCVYNMLVNDSQLLSLLEFHNYEDYKEWLQKAGDITRMDLDTVEKIFPSLEFYCMTDEEIVVMGGEHNKSENSDMLSAYGNILWQYYDVWNSGNLNLEMNSNPENIVNYLLYFGNYDGTISLAFTLEDLDGNGIQELLIGMLSNGSCSVIDVFSYVDGAVIHMFSGAERSHLTICEDGIISENGSGGAQHNFQHYYKINEDGKSCDTILYYYINSENYTVEEVDGTITAFDGNYDKYLNVYSEAQFAWTGLNEDNIAEETVQRNMAGPALKGYDIVQAPYFRNGLCENIWSVLQNYYLRKMGANEYQNVYFDFDYENNDHTMEYADIVELQTGQVRYSVSVNLGTGDAVEQSWDGTVDYFNVFDL